MATGGPKPEETKAEVAPVVDTADVSPRGPEPDTSGKRVRGIPQRGGTLIEITRADFKKHDIDHETVQFSGFKDNWTLAVGKSISVEAAEFLTKFAPETFEFLS